MKVMYLGKWGAFVKGWIVAELSFTVNIEYVSLYPVTWFKEEGSQISAQRNSSELGHGLLSRWLSSHHHHGGGGVHAEKSVAHHTVNLLTSTIKDLVPAIEDRGLKTGKAMFQELTGLKKPILDKDHILHWHVLLLYAEVMSSDFIEDFCGTDITKPFLPDNKAIDLIDEAGSRVRLRHAQDLGDRVLPLKMIISFTGLEYPGSNGSDREDNMGYCFNAEFAGPERDLVSAIEDRGLKIGKAMFQRIEKTDIR
ncbi:hypothetical protein Tco_0898529 [Tanacetum coccineum]